MIRPVMPLCGAVLGAALGAQQPRPVPEAREVPFLAEAAKELHAHAGSWFKVGFAQRARRIWLEVLAEYDPDHEPSWNALGFMRFGTTWAPDESRPYPELDRAPPSRARSLEKKWERLAATLAEGHRDLARALEGDGASARARYHDRRVLRFAPRDEQAGAALGYGEFDGIFGDPAELAVLRRSRHLRQAVDFLSRATFPVERIPTDTTHPLLERSGISYRGVRSANFQVWGDLQSSLLMDAAQWAERCLWFCRTAFGERRNFRSEPVSAAELAFFREHSVWKQVVRRNADLFDQQYLQFLLDHSLAAYLNEGSRCVYVAAEREPERVFDHVVRKVTEDLANLHTAGMREGIGHAVVAMFFGRNLVYLIDAKSEPEHQPHTVSGRRDRDESDGVLHPDLDAWLRIAADQAWSRESVAAAGLPLVRADRFELADRVKAWAFCDYLLRREPDLLRALDESAEGAAVPADVARAFPRLSGGVDLGTLEADWRRFWTEDSRLQPEPRKQPDKAARARPGPLERKADLWLTALNDLRLRLGLTPVGWIRCRDDVAARAAALGVKSSSSPPSGAAAAFARRALAATGGPPADAVGGWLHRPGYRHAVLDPDLSIVGFAEHAGVVLLDVGEATEGRAPGTQVYPLEEQADVRARLDVAEVGPPLARLLAARGAAGLAHVGYPLTLHLRGPGSSEVTGVACLVRCADRVVEGIVHVSPDSEESADRRLDAPGLVTFYPLQPFDGGAVVEVTWSWNPETGGRREHRYRFRTR